MKLSLQKRNAKRNKKNKSPSNLVEKKDFNREPLEKHSLPNPAKINNENYQRGTTRSELEKQKLALRNDIVILLRKVISSLTKPCLIATSLLVGFCIIELAKFVSSHHEPAMQLAFISLPEILKTLHFIEMLEITTEIPLTEKVKEWLADKFGKR
jgi:hypothetical protein